MFELIYINYARDITIERPILVISKHKSIIHIQCNRLILDDFVTLMTIRKEKIFMKKTKILVPALSILALGMAASITGTVAWFSANDKVYADGIFIQTKTAQSLVISESGAAGTWASKITHTAGRVDANTPKEMEPVFNLNQNNTALAPSFVKLNTALVNPTGDTLPTYEVADNGKVYPYGSVHSDQTVVAPATPAANNPWIAGVEDTDFLKLEEYLKLDTNDSTASVNVALSLNAAASNSEFQNIDKALTVGIYVWTTNYETGEDTGGLLATVKPFSSGFASYTGNANVTPFAVTPNAKHISVYAWYDGEDQNCINANAVQHPITITLTWSVSNS